VLPGAVSFVVTRRVLIGRAGLVLVAVLAVAGCSSGPITRTAVGTVVEVAADRLCLDEVGDPVPQCYLAEPGQLSAVRQGECVRVTATVRVGRAPIRELTSVDEVSAADHADECAPS
jgi:hypothetical protein